MSGFALNVLIHSPVYSLYFKVPATLLKQMLKQKTMNKKYTRHDRASNSRLEIVAAGVSVVDQIYSCLKVLHLEQSHLEIATQVQMRFRGLAIYFFAFFTISMFKHFLFLAFFFSCLLSI